MPLGADEAAAAVEELRADRWGLGLGRARGAVPLCLLMLYYVENVPWLLKPFLFCTVQASFAMCTKHHLLCSLKARCVMLSVVADENGVEGRVMLMMAISVVYARWHQYVF